MKIPPVFLAASCFIGFATHAAAETDISLAPYLKDWVDLLECNQGSPEIQQLCQLVSAEIDAKLNAAGISITPDAILFHYADETAHDIPTGHGCTVRLQQTGFEVDARLDSSADINLSGNPLSSAAVIAMNLPVQISAVVHGKVKFGIQLPWAGCRVIGQDNFDVNGGLSTVAHIMVFFALAPSLHTDADGNYVLTIKPITDVVAKLQDTRITDVSIGGLSDWSKIADFVLTLPSNMYQLALDATVGIGAILGGASADSVLQNLSDDLTVFLQDLGIGVVDVIPVSVLNSLLPVFAQYEVKKMKSKGDNEATSQLAATVRAAVARALDLDANGEHTFVIHKDFASIVKRSGAEADIWLPPKNPPWCRSNQDCDDGLFCNGEEICGFEQCFPGKPPCRPPGPFERLFCSETEKKCHYTLHICPFCQIP
jgi:hypothetical protein